jgi:hypothetical protein
MGDRQKKKKPLVGEQRKGRSKTKAPKPLIASYNRTAALAYARKYWNHVCTDNYIAGDFAVNTADELFPLGSAYRSVPAGTKFVHQSGNDGRHWEYAQLPDGSRIEWKHLDDCTHFLSCCLGNPPGQVAGGLNISSAFPQGPYGQVGASSLVAFMRDQGWATILKVQDKGNPPTSSISPGDIIAYFNKNLGRYTHLAMYLGGKKIVCHSYSRSDSSECTWDNDFDLLGRESNFEWHFIKVKV